MLLIIIVGNEKTTKKKTQYVKLAMPLSIEIFPVGLMHLSSPIIVLVHLTDFYRIIHEMHAGCNKYLRMHG